MPRESPQHRLVEQLAARGICDRRVLDALEKVPRDRFVPARLQSRAWDDHALPIEAGQTISQPYMVALMTQELRLSGVERVLEIGTGSGYQTAVLAELCREVVTIERLPELSRSAQILLAELGHVQIRFRVGDGSLGVPEGAPYDGIIVTAGAPELPGTLYDQLAIGGRLVIPLGTGRPQMLQTIVRGETGPVVRDVCECSFVPLIGAAGWGEDRASEEME